MPYKLGNITVFYLGEEGSGTKLRSGEDGYQDFNAIRDSCLASGKLFDDPEFILSNDKMETYDANLDFKRPKEIQEKYYKDGNKAVFSLKGKDDDLAISRYDIHQGDFGDCGTLAYFAGGMLSKDVRNMIFPDDNTLEDGKYCGVFHFRYYLMGRWLDVVIDDRLPVRMAGNSNDIVGMHGLMPSVDSEAKVTEYWPNLLEKAWAKMAGSFLNITACQNVNINTAEAMSGGFLDVVNTRDAKSFEALVYANENGSFGSTGQKDGYCNLVGGHAYSWTGITEVETNDGKKVRLLRFRNPWGNTEYNGPWSDSSPQWSTVSPEVKKNLGLQVREDGEFWMDYDTYTDTSGSINVCRLVAEELNDHTDSGWYYQKFTGFWKDASLGTQCLFLIDNPTPVDVIFHLSTYGTNYGSVETDVGTSLKVYRVGEKGEGVEEHRSEEYFEGLQPIATFSCKLGKQLWPNKYRLRAGTYCAVVSVEKLTPQYEEFCLRLLWPPS